MTGAAVLLACDWGNTNLRAWTLDAQGAVVARQSFPLGVLQLQPGEVARRFKAEVRPALGAENLPALLCGAVGSNVGWASVPYVDCAAGAPEVARGLAAVAPATWIAPGVRCAGLAGQPDVMRGEETQIFGWLAQDPSRQAGRHVICLPGTHSKWAIVEEGQIIRFVSAMTGELFALLTRHSILKSDSTADNPTAFAAGLAAAGDGADLALRLFTARSRVAGGAATLESTPSYLSGLLIGAEVASAMRLIGGAADRIVLLGETALCSRYREVLAAFDTAADVHDGEAAAVAGLFALHQLGDAT